MKLVSNLSELITEIAAISDMTDSIKKRNVVTIYYDGNDNGGKGYRTIEPVCLGFSKRDNMVLRAWEREGASYSAQNKGNVLPGWRLFRVDKIFTYKPSFDNFDEVRPNYNPQGDKSMIRVLVNAKFDNE
jgi:predicted DNA-binding transcriptional regulator YafY